MAKKTTLCRKCPDKAPAKAILFTNTLAMVPILHVNVQRVLGDGLMQIQYTKEAGDTYRLEAPGEPQNVYWTNTMRWIREYGEDTP